MSRNGRIVAALALALLFSAGASGQSAAVKEGDKVPDASFTTLLNNDGRTTLAEFRGNVVVLDWWGNH